MNDHPICHILELAGYETRVWEWGNPSNPAILCVHGLGGQGSNHRSYAARLAKDFRLICPDLPGRGLSKWAVDPTREYNFDTYERLILELIEWFSLAKMHWLGVSMGGALGIRLAASSLSAGVASLVLNDIGPSMPDPVAEGIAASAQVDTRFASLHELASHMETHLGGLGMQPAAEGGWLEMAANGCRRRDDGSFALHFDPRVAEQLRHSRDDFEQWEAFDAIEAPILLVRGALSDVLPKQVADRMLQRPNCTLELYPDCGHAPLLDRPADADRLRAFFQAAQP